MIKHYTLKDLTFKDKLTLIKKVFKGKSAMRVLFEHYLEKAIKENNISGKVVLDVGGRKSEAKNIQQVLNHNHYIIANISPKSDVIFDATKTHPFKDNSIDIVSSYNLAEHLNEFETHFAEMVRISKKWILVYVPLAIYYHPDPKDYWRFTHDALEEIFSKLNVKTYRIIPVGLGPWWLILQYRLAIYGRLGKFGLIRVVHAISAMIKDLLYIKLYYALKKSSEIHSTYALGELVIAKK